MLAAMSTPRYTALLERLADAVRLPLPTPSATETRPELVELVRGEYLSLLKSVRKAGENRRTRCCTRCASRASGCATPVSWPSPRWASRCGGYSRPPPAAEVSRRPPGRLRGQQRIRELVDNLDDEADPLVAARLWVALRSSFSDRAHSESEPQARMVRPSAE